MKLASVNALDVDALDALKAHIASDPALSDWAAAAAATDTTTEFADYICDLGETISDETIATTSTTRGAEAGKYVIFFHVKDRADNHECDTKSRTVVVRDTLPPVISLHDTLTGDLLHTSDYTKKGLGFEENPAMHGFEENPAGKLAHGSAYGYDHNNENHTDGNPYLESIHEAADLPLANGQFEVLSKATLSASSVAAVNAAATRPSAWRTLDNALMAEQQASSSSNGWIMAAAASGITGLALLASAQRKTTVTSVPV